MLGVRGVATLALMLSLLLRLSGFFGLAPLGAWSYPGSVDGGGLAIDSSGSWLLS